MLASATARLAFFLATAWAVVVACSESTIGAAPLADGPPSVEDLARSFAGALTSRDWSRAAAQAHEDTEVRIEIRQVLVETDEREARTLRGRDELRTAFEGFARDLDPLREGARWPKGIGVAGGWQPLGDCADAFSPSVPAGTLVLRRVCYAERRGATRGLTYVVFAEAR